MQSTRLISYHADIKNRIKSIWSLSTANFYAIRNRFPEWNHCCFFTLWNTFNQRETLPLCRACRGCDLVYLRTDVNAKVSPEELNGKIHTILTLTKTTSTTTQLYDRLVELLNHFASRRSEPTRLKSHKAQWTSVASYPQASMLEGVLP